MAYLWFFWFVLTTLTVGALVYLDPEKARPSMDDGASAAEQMTMQQRVMKAVSLKNVTQSEASVSQGLLCTCTMPKGMHKLVTMQLRIMTMPASSMQLRVMYCWLCWPAFT